MPLTRIRNPTQRNSAGGMHTAILAAASAIIFRRKHHRLSPKQSLLFVAADRNWRFRWLHLRNSVTVTETRLIKCLLWSELYVKEA
jgi:hypothetical protein